MDYKTMHKWSEINNLAVVTLTDGKKVGTVEDFYFDPQTNTVPAFLVKTGLLSHRALKTNGIKAFGQDAITVTNEETLIAEKADAQLSTLPLGRGLLSYKVMSESGTLIGTIGNVLLDLNTPSTISIAAYEMAGGLRQRLSQHYPTFEASRISRYGQDVIVIPDAVAVELSQ